MIKAVIFDMDGLLIDSEPCWREAIVEILNKVGAPLTLDMCKETMGFRVDEVVDYWFTKYNIQRIEKGDIVKNINEEVARLIDLKAEIMEGVFEVIALVESQGLPMAIASASPMNVINTVLNKIKVGDKMKIISSAKDEPYGKPHPGVFITTANKMGIAPVECLVFEDSTNGVLAAKAAKMKCVAIPDSTMLNDKRFGIADLTLHSLKDFTLEHLLHL